MKPQLSVIIPTYNRADFLPAAIDSVFQQKRSPLKYEVIVVDDGSTDDTEKIAKKYGARVRYFKIAHSGKPAVPRNYGLAKARGELVAFQDSDDLWQPDKLATQLPLFDDPKIVLSYGNARVMDAAGHQAKALYIKPAELAGGQSFAGLLKSNVISTLTVVARKAVIEAAGGFNQADDVRAVEDYDLWLRLVAAHPKGLKAVAKPLAIHRAHPGNISQADDLLALERILSVYDQLWTAKLSNAQRRALEKQIEQHHRDWDRLQDKAGSYPLISVVMGIYKDEKYVKKAVTSILDQSFSDFEFIIINDGSPDKSADVVRAIKDPRIRLIHQTNRGLVATLNKGISLARGQFIARQDADDISQPTRLAKELELLMARPKVGVVSVFFAYIDEKSKLTGTVITGLLKHLDLRRALYVNNPFSHGGAMFRKSAYQKAGGYTSDYGPTEDYVLWCKLADLEWELAMIPEVLYLYRLVPTGISQLAGSVQHDFAAKIVGEQFAKPFVYKGYRTIVGDGKYYWSLASPFAEQIFHQYVNEQFIISLEMLARGWAKSGTITALATSRLDRHFLRRLIRPIIGGWLRKLNLKPRKT